MDCVLVQFHPWFLFCSVSNSLPWFTALHTPPKKQNQYIAPRIKLTQNIREAKLHVKWQTWICTMWPGFPVLVIHCSLFLHINNISSFMQLFIRKNCFELFLSAHFLFWEILNLNLTFAIYMKLELSIFNLNHMGNLSAETFHPFAFTSWHSEKSQLFLYNNYTDTWIMKINKHYSTHSEHCKIMFLLRL